MLGQLLGVGQQVLFQRHVGFLGGAARAGAGDRAHGDQAVLDAHQHFRRTAHHVEVAEVEEVHVGGRVEAAQRAVQVDGRGAEVDGHALRRDHLHAVTGEDVFLDGVHRALVVLAGEAGAELRFRRVHRAEVEAAARSDRLAQVFQQFLQTRMAVLVGIGLGRVGEDDGVHLAGQVVEHHHGVGHHQQDVRVAQRVRVRALRQALLDVAHAVIAEVADQPAVEARQPRQGRYAVAVLELFDEGQRVFAFEMLGLDAVDLDARRVAVDPQHGAAGQADDRVAAPLLAALHGFEQVGVGTVGQLQVDGQRGVEIGEGFAGERNAVVAFCGQPLEFFASHDRPRVRKR
ncbi:hypothetical protein FQZ97_624610 [compost metagenome]